MSDINTHLNGKPLSDIDRFESVVNNVLMVRQEFFRRFLDPRRDLDAECGYPSSTSGGTGVGSLNMEIYKTLYERESVATRVVQLMPKESWQVQPLVYEDEDSDNETDFERAWDQLGKNLQGVNSYYKDEKGSPIWEHLRRADILSGIGHFGVLLIGIDDGKALDQPVDGVVSMLPPSVPSGEIKGQTVSGLPSGIANPYSYSQQYGTPLAGAVGTDAQYVGVQLGPPEYPATVPATEERKLLFLRSFDESLVQVVQYEADLRNPRFGSPVMYRITLNDPREQHSGVGLSIATVRVHWSRVIHLADNLGSSEIFGIPRMRPVLNRLLDLRKLYGGSAEMYWKGAFPGLSLSTHPQLGGDVDVDEGKVRDNMENYFNGLQRYIALMGMQAQTLSPTVVDPTPQINTQIEAICIQLGCPKRIFMGSERGELASSQDDASWNDRLRERQNNYITPRIIVPFIDRLIAMGVLPVPKAKVKKPNLKPLTSLSITPKSNNGDEDGNRDGFPPKKANPFSKGVANSNGDTSSNKNGKIDDDTGYHIEWPSLDSLTETDKATIALQQTQALVAYVSGNVEAVLPPIDYLTRILGMEEEEAQSILDAAARAQEEKQADQQALVDEHGMIPTPPPGFQHPEPSPVIVGGKGIPPNKQDAKTAALAKAQQKQKT